MALLFMDGFDKYGGANNNATSVTALMAGEWTTITNAGIAAPLSSTGQSLQNSPGGSMTVSKTLATNYSRLIGGVRFSSTLGANLGIQFQDAGSNQTGIQITVSTGIISLRSGAYSSGTVLGSSSSGVAANVTHYLEWDITFGASAAYAVYLDGVSIISGTGHTIGTANSTANAVQLIVSSGTSAGTYDDFYLFDTTGSTNNAVLLTSPRIETTIPASDSSVQFSVGASVLGPTMTRTANTMSASSTNTLVVRSFIPSRNCTLNSISLTANATNGTLNLKPIIYSDSSNYPGTLLSTGSTVTGISPGVTVTMPLTTPQSLTAGTRYWLGYQNDANTINAFQCADALNSGLGNSSTFGSPPSTYPASPSTFGTPMMWGNVTLSSAANYYEVNQTPPPLTNTSYVQDSTVSDEDLYNFASLSALPATIYAVAMKAYCERDSSGARTVSLRINSSGTDSGGSSTGQTPGTSYAWIGSFFETDPHTAAAWLGTNLNAATAGFKIDA